MYINNNGKTLSTKNNLLLIRYPDFAQSNNFNGPFESYCLSYSYIGNVLLIPHSWMFV